MTTTPSAQSGIVNGTLWRLALTSGQVIHGRHRRPGPVDSEFPGLRELLHGDPLASRARHRAGTHLTVAPEPTRTSEPIRTSEQTRTSEPNAAA
ncbi:hypothetical protein [Kribbella sp. NPDC051770]|uniref:hypothetical protein n=1 Tax=Kribbella sp. NPDC051770 TaxID=3155413 RepID=UPI00341CFE15